MRWLRTACLGGLLVEGLLPQTAAAYNPSDRYVFPIAQLSLGPRFQLQPEDSVGVLFTVEAGAAIGWPQSLSIFHLGGRRSLWQMCIRDRLWVGRATGCDQQQTQ